MSDAPALNVYGKTLKVCSTKPLTGFYRSGKCQTGEDDYGTHIACAIVDDTFLQYSKSMGNDLITPFPERNFPGLVSGDQWCLCISRWVEAMEQGVAPKLDLEATHQKALEFVSLETLKEYNAK